MIVGKGSTWLLASVKCCVAYKLNQEVAVLLCKPVLFVFMFRLLCLCVYSGLTEEHKSKHDFNMNFPNTIQPLNYIFLKLYHHFFFYQFYLQLWNIHEASYYLFSRQTATHLSLILS